MAATPESATTRVKMEPNMLGNENWKHKTQMSSMHRETQTDHLSL